MENSLFLGVPKFRHISMWLNIGTPKTINFPFETNGKLMALGVPIGEAYLHINISLTLH